VPVAAEDGYRKSQDQLRDEDLDCEEVHHALYVALLVAALLTVHHDASLAPRVNHKADHPLRVLQIGALQKQLLMTQREVLLFSYVEITAE